MKLKTIGTLIFLSLSSIIYAQLKFKIDEIRFYNIEESSNPDVIVENGCIGPGLWMEGYIQNTSNQEFVLSTIEARFFILFTFKDANYIEELNIFSFGGLQDSLLLTPNSKFEISLISKTAFMDSFYSPSKKTYYDEINKIVPTIKILYYQEFISSNDFLNVKLFVSQNVTKENIKFSLND